MREDDRLGWLVQRAVLALLAEAKYLNHTKTLPPIIYMTQ